MAEDQKKSPYVAWTTFNNFVESLAENPQMAPPRIDSSVMKGMSGGTQSQTLIALRFFGLVYGENDLTDDSFKELIKLREPGRKEWAAGALDEHYPEAMELASRSGTAGELSELFEQLYEHRGSTRDKAIRFYLQMAQFAGVEVSPHFAVPRASSGNRKRKKLDDPGGKGSTENPDDPPPPPPLKLSADPLVVAYVEKLPPSGSVWSTAERQRWLNALTAIFDIVYQHDEGGDYA